jgi:fumarylacetoacetase
MALPFEVADYVDFYSSEHHAQQRRQDLPAEPAGAAAAWRHLPIGYHGRAGTVVVAAPTSIRPCGQRSRPAGAGHPEYGPSLRLDIEAEVGFVVGVPSRLGERVTADAFAEHVFGVVLLNDWSARDIQAWEYQPLGPFLGKSFATSISGWVTPWTRSAAARCRRRARTRRLCPYLAQTERYGYDIRLRVEWNGTTVSRQPFAGLYWTPAQQLAHLTVNGASLRTATSTPRARSPARAGRDGSFLELTWGGVRAGDARRRAVRRFLEDGDTVTITATAPGADGEHDHGWARFRGELPRTVRTGGQVCRHRQLPYDHGEKSDDVTVPPRRRQPMPTVSVTRAMPEAVGLVWQVFTDLAGRPGWLSHRGVRGAGRPGMRSAPAPGGGKPAGSWAASLSPRSWRGRGRGRPAVRDRFAGVGADYRMTYTFAPIEVGRLRGGTAVSTRLEGMPQTMTSRFLSFFFGGSRRATVEGRAPRGPRRARRGLRGPQHDQRGLTACVRARPTRRRGTCRSPPACDRDPHPVARRTAARSARPPRTPAERHAPVAQRQPDEIGLALGTVRSDRRQQLAQRLHDPLALLTTSVARRAISASASRAASAAPGPGWRWRTA